MGSITLYCVHLTSPEAPQGKAHENIRQQQEMQVQKHLCTRHLIHTTWKTQRHFPRNFKREAPVLNHNKNI